MRTKFWSHTWAGLVPFMDKFTSLYNTLGDQEAVGADKGEKNGADKWRWVRIIFSPCLEVADEWRWVPCADGVFIVNFVTPHF